jgi:hypothetical protein
LSVGFVTSKVNSELEQAKRAYSINIKEGKDDELSTRSCNPKSRRVGENTINKEISVSASGLQRELRLKAL